MNIDKDPLVPIKGKRMCKGFQKKREKIDMIVGGKLTARVKPLHTLDQIRSHTRACPGASRSFILEIQNSSSVKKRLCG